MKITRLEMRPLRIPYRTPFHWARGVIEAAEVVLISVHTDEGIVGYGESMSSATADAVKGLLQTAEQLCVGHSPFEVNSLVQGIYQHLFAARGNCSNRRFGALTVAGLDMALWDLIGKATGRAVHEVLGGAVREGIQYFGFPQGNTPEEIGEDARRWSEQGCAVIYAKIGRGEALDIAVAEQVRGAIGDKRLRLDANEAWDVLTARRMITSLVRFGVEFIEQPVRSDSLAALEQVKASSLIPIAADQVVFTPEDVYEVCRHHAADLIVLGLHETGGIERFRKAAAIADAAGLNVCLHGLYETGITTCASHQAGLTIPNLDDGNQYMNHLLIEDVVQSPNLALRSGQIPRLTGPGLGFELNWDAVARAEERYRNRQPLLRARAN